jgi:hypothetical protein
MGRVGHAVESSARRRVIARLADGVEDGVAAGRSQRPARNQHRVVAHGIVRAIAAGAREGVAALASRRTASGVVT